MKTVHKSAPRSKADAGFDEAEVDKARIYCRACFRTHVVGAHDYPVFALLEVYFCETTGAVREANQWLCVALRLAHIDGISASVIALLLAAQSSLQRGMLVESNRLVCTAVAALGGGQ